MPDAKDPGFAPKTYRRDCLLGALGALLMLAGDLCLSVIPANPGGQRPVCQRSIFKRVVRAVAAAAAAGNGLCGMALGAEISTWDFVLSQGSGNAALFIRMMINAVWAARQEKKER